MASVPTALLQQLLGFIEARVQSLLATTLKDASSLASELRDDPLIPNDLQTDLQNLVSNLAAKGKESQRVATTVQGFAADAAQASSRIATRLAPGNLTLPDAALVAADVAKVAADLDAAIHAVADYVASTVDPLLGNSVRSGILGSLRPWSSPLRSLPAGAGSLLDSFANQLLGAAGATSQLAGHLTLDRSNQILAASLSSAGERAPVPAIATFTLEAVILRAFIGYGTQPNVGMSINAVVNTGLRSDGLLEQIVPAAAPKAKSKAITVQLDTESGLSLGSGSPAIMLQTSFDSAGIELRDATLAVSNAAEGQLDLTATVAGNLGDVISVVVEGGGLRISLSPSTPWVTAALLAPDGAGINVNAGLVTGGGFLKQSNGEYGGALALRLTKFGITAIGLLSTSPFSLVLVLGFEFFPAFELGLGFTLNGVGGLLALQRRVDSDALRQTILDGAADTILFPRDPVAAAPTILATLGNLFPTQPGGFVVGPIAELGWGSQAKLVTAKIGVVISLPDPKVILLGAVRVAVPTTEVSPDLCIIDLNAGLVGVVTAEFTYLAAGLFRSRVAGISVSGDVAFYVTWGSSPDVALTVGGFHPHYSPPPILTGTRRISLDLSPPFPLTIHADGYVAITSNTLQFGAQVWLTADIGIASGEAGLGFDALFRWAPRLFFEADINAQICIKAFGETFANIQFTGHLEGTRPWRIEATATVDVWYLPTIHFDVGPFQWGADDETPEPAISPQQIVADAMKPDQAWAPILPSGADTLVRFKSDDSTVLLAHPLGGVQVRQIKVPLEIQIDRVGKSPVTAHRVNLASPKLGTKSDAVVSDVQELFALGDFLNLSDDDSLSRPGFELRPAGAQLTATSSPVSGPPTDADYKWDTIFPDEETLKPFLYLQTFAGICSAVLRSGPVAYAARARGNAYTVPANPIQLSPAGMKEIRRTSDLGVVSGITARTTTAEATQTLANLRRTTGSTADLEMVTAGVAS